LLEQLHETRLQKLEQGHDILSRDYSRLNDAIVKISESLTALVVIQEQNKSIMQCIERQSTTIEKLDARIDAIELQMPQLVESRQLVMVGLGFIVSAVIVSLIALVIK
jgi:predicted  nucleic acid-binding Zn-ribbon protein